MKLWYYILLFSFLFMGCEPLLDFSIEGNGIVENTSIYINEPFEQILLQENLDLEIYNYVKDSVFISAESNLLPFINFIVKDEKLVIKIRDNKVFITNYDLKIKLFAKNILAIENIGNGKIIVDSLTGRNLDIMQNRKGTIDIKHCEVDKVNITQENNNLIRINGDFNQLKIMQVGSGTMKLSGNSFESKIVQNGSGEVTTYNLKTKEMSVEQYGNGLIYCYADSIFNVIIGGDGRVFYRGNPKVVSELKEAHYLVKDYN